MAIDGLVSHPPKCIGFAQYGAVMQTMLKGGHVATVRHTLVVCGTSREDIKIDISQAVRLETCTPLAIRVLHDGVGL